MIYCTVAMRPIKKPFAVLIVSFVSLLVLAVPQVAQAKLFENSVEEACKGAQLSNKPVAGCGQKAAEDTLNSTIATAINLFSLFIAITAVISIMIGGLRYITANGDAGNLTSARNTILYSLIGLIIAAFAQIIVRYVLNTAVT